MGNIYGKYDIPKIKYKLTLLKDLPDIPSGKEVLNVTQEELNDEIKFEINHGTKNSKIYELVNNADWVKVEEDNRCLCKTKSFLTFYYQYLGYGMCSIGRIDFNNKELHCSADWKCDTGTKGKIDIKYCPFCGEKL